MITLRDCEYLGGDFTTQIGGDQPPIPADTRSIDIIDNTSSLTNIAPGSFVNIRVDFNSVSTATGTYDVFVPSQFGFAACGASGSFSILKVEDE